MTQRVLEIRSYVLQPGSGARFHELFSTRSLPLLAEVKMDVVAYGASLHEPDNYYLMRAFDSMQHLQESQDGFYASDAWRKGPREDILALIVSSANTVLELEASTIESMRRNEHA